MPPPPAKSDAAQPGGTLSHPLLICPPHSKPLSHTTSHPFASLTGSRLHRARHVLRLPQFGTWRDFTPMRPQREPLAQIFALKRMVLLPFLHGYRLCCSCLVLQSGCVSCAMDTCVSRCWYKFWSHVCDLRSDIRYGITISISHVMYTLWYGRDGLGLNAREPRPVQFPFSDFDRSE